MSLINWDNSFSVQVAEIDAQHKQLIAIINKLHAAMKEGDGTPVLEEIIGELVNYTKVHFTTEEKYFREFNYQHADEHIREHRMFEEKIDEFAQDFKQKKISLQVSLLTFLHNWLKDHLEGEDQKYVECFIQHGLS